MNLSFIKLDINIMNDSKIKFIRKLPNGDGLIVLWIGILCLGMKASEPGIVEIGDGIPFTAETLATELDIQLNTVKLGLETFVKFKMVEIWNNKEIFIVNFEKHQALGKIRTARKKSRITSKRYRTKLKRITDVIVTPSSRYPVVTDSDKTERDIELEQEKEKEKSLQQEEYDIKTKHAHTREDNFCQTCQCKINPEDSICPNCGDEIC